MDVMARRRALLHNRPDLPPMFRAVEYIESNQSAYIQTDYTPQQNDEIFVRFMPYKIDGSMHCLFSAGDGTYQLIALAYSTNTDKFYCKYFASGGAKELLSNNVINLWADMHVTPAGQFISNNASITSPYEQALDGSSTKLRIFGRVGTSKYPYAGRLSMFRIVNDGVLKLNLIPCVNVKSGVTGVYDTVGKTFYSSANADPFYHG